MNFVIGMLIGGLIMAFTPNLALEIRKATNSLAHEVETATSEEDTWQKLEEDTISLLQEKVDDLRK